MKFIFSYTPTLVKHATMDVVFQSEGAQLLKGDFQDKALIEKCIQEIQGHLEEKPEITVFGKQCRQQRNIGFFSNTSRGYEYSRKLMPSKPLSQSMEQLLIAVNESVGGEFNGILVNEYNGGDDYISAHSDDEKGITHAGVVSISWGEERIFRVRDKKTKKIVHDEPTTAFSILQMKGERFQKNFTHEIPKTKKSKGKRISFTFRKHLE